MATVNNFRAEDFPQGKKIKEGTNPVREDNKILEKEVAHAVRDDSEGNKFAEDFAERVESAEAKLAAEVNNTVEEGTVEEQTAKVSDRRTSTDLTKAGAAATKHINDEVAKTTYERKAK